MLIFTFILSMAVNYSPEEVNFLIIDYKGASMANELKNLQRIKKNTVVNTASQGQRRR